MYWSPFMRFRLPALLALSLLGVSFGLESQAAEEPGRPNLILFVSDDHRADLLGGAGHPILKTPELDELAARGVRFTNAFVTTSICAASRATILTGVYERGHRYTFGTPPMAARFCEASYPALLREAGYRTGFVGKFGVNVPEGMTDQMFDRFENYFRNPYFKEQPDGTERHLTEIIGDRAIAFLEDQPAEQPFCLSVSFNAPHAEDNDKENHYPPIPLLEPLYEDVNVPPPHLSEPEVFEALPEFLRASMNRDRWYWRWDTPEKYQKNIKDYYRMLSGVDLVIGRVLEALQRRGLAENTVVIFTGDNGYYMGARGLAGKWSHFEESLRVPLIIAPASESRALEGRLEERMALNVDLAPTILDLAGMAVPETYQGRSLAPLYRGSTPENWRTEFFCEHLFDHPDIPKWEGVRTQRWKYARYFEQDPPYEFLHDLETDRRELENLAEDPDAAEQLERLRRRCDAWIGRLEQVRRGD